MRAEHAGRLRADLLRAAVGNGANPKLTPDDGGYMYDEYDDIASMPSNPNANTDAFNIAYYPG